MDGTNQIVEILESMWPRNKAKGLYAQAALSRDVDTGRLGSDASEKFLSGCWFLAPKEANFYKFRFSFFIHPSVIKSGEKAISPKKVLGEKYRPFHALSEFLDNAGIGVIYVTMLTQNGELPLEDIMRRNYKAIEWNCDSFQNGEFVPKNLSDFFKEWPGDRGRPSRGNEWETQTRNNIKSLNNQTLTELLLHELFMTSLVKGVFRKPLNDPYDIDSFLISISQKHILPMEIKQKFPAESRDGKFFGIDAGRVMMLLRICLPNDSNAVYLIREVSEAGDFVGWKYITLGDIVMTSSWNLQAGGAGMGGQGTQTIRLPYDYFKEFGTEVTSEDNLKKLGNLPKEAKTIAKDFGIEISSRFYRRDK